MKNTALSIDTSAQPSLSECVGDVLQHYFTKLNGEEPREVYDFFLNIIKKPLLQTVMDFVQGNQSETARILGLSRGTLRTMLQEFDML